MQTLWTRVAQVRVSCHCPQCLTSTSAVARRAAATATRRAPRFWTSSTVWYSGIFAVAATLDLGVKQQRREQWNKAIADVKQELGRSDDADANRAFLDELERETVASTEMREHLDSSPLRTHMPEWPASTGQGRMTNKLPPQSIYTDNRKKAKHMLGRWYPKKMERVQLSIDAMQLEFFLELHRRGWHEEAARAVPDWYAEHILQPVQAIEKTAAIKHQDLNAIMRLKGKFSFGGEDEEAGRAEFATWERSEGDTPLCSYSQDELGRFHDTAYDLNATLRKLFDMGRDRVLTAPAVLAKVYHNLSVSSAPPNIDTYNTLIVGLADIGTRRLVEDCINSLQCAKIRHNEVSLASILNYWTLTGNDEEFQYWVQLMRGDWHGLALAHAGVEITKSSQGRLIRKQDGKRVIQLPSPTPMVFGALIKGVIKFSGFDAALSVCEAARDEGWGLCKNGLYALLKDCSQRRDWAAGLATWNQMQALRRTPPERFESSILKPGGWKLDPIDLPTFATMLQLCTRCNNRTAFQDIMEQAVMTHPNFANDLIRMVRAERSEMKTNDESTTQKLTQLSDVSNWLEAQNIHQHTDELKSMPWQDIVRLDSAGLEAKGVKSDDERERLLKIFQQVRKAHPFNTETPWLSIAADRRHRARVLNRRKARKEEEAFIAENSDRRRRTRTQQDDAHERKDAKLQESHNQHAHHDAPDLEMPALYLAHEQDQQPSYAIGMASILDKMDSDSTIQTYQPIRH